MFGLFEKLKSRKKWSRFVQKWRDKNHHNGTIPGNFFNVDNVTVGKKTYGALNIIDSTTVTDRKFLKIGNYCSIGGGYNSYSVRNIILLQFLLIRLK